ncbi:MAG: zinc-ribbon domain-containing protein [Planktomarina sp.]|uniref:zinc-ribbon domain-containing protein n=1 Tax=Planktomarina sp. TaxID=2024851 RepID=UPI0032610C62|nr:zinc-ribbon domain-containing protein [Planktomarina sp.]
MRLLCPNCDAEYEIPDDVIPAEGRDVQCSGCQETWFVPADTPPRARTSIDPKVSSILQQEVQREMEARKAETRGANDTAPEPASAPRPQADPAPVSKQLPPIDRVEISPLISPADDAPALTKPVMPSQAPEEVAPLDSQQRGTVAAFLILGVLTAIYIFAPQLTETFPSQTDRLNAYVFWVDDLRQWLQQGLRAILDYRMSFSL